MRRLRLRNQRERRAAHLPDVSGGHYLEPDVREEDGPQRRGVAFASVGVPFRLAAGTPLLSRARVRCRRGSCATACEAEATRRLSRDRLLRGCRDRSGTDRHGRAREGAARRRDLRDLRRRLLRCERALPSTDMAPAGACLARPARPRRGLLADRRYVRAVRLDRDVEGLGDPGPCDRVGRSAPRKHPEALLGAGAEVAVSSS
jgi:hypothetical protein